MPRRAKGPRLYRDPARGQYIIRDGPRFIRLGAASTIDAEKSLAQYIADKHRPTPSQGPIVADILSAYATDVAAHRKTAANMSYNIGSLLKWWGAKQASEITARNCRAYAATKTNAAAAQDLKILRAACNHWSKEYAALSPPPVIVKPPEGKPRDRWLTRSELARLLWAARRQQHLRRFILLAYYTGSRPGVILRLQWDQIDLPQAVMLRIRPQEAQDAKKRAPPVRLGRRILTHLRRWQRLDNGTVTFLCHYEGRPTYDPHTTWDKAVAAAGLEGVTRHTLRHTRATHLMQSGRVSIWDAAGFLGMTTRTLERVYGHHSPDHQGDAPEI